MCVLVFKLLEDTVFLGSLFASKWKQDEIYNRWDQVDTQQPDPNSTLQRDRLSFWKNGETLKDSE